ncbi:MAG: hypothetical protein GSR78_01790 [Desulfurococcales archaeon]|nr:hypothetical protein [Desulfurococcales archaeon]
MNPVYIVSGISHVARSWDTTVFEISMLGGWLKIAVARIISVVVYMIPYVIVQSIILYLFSAITHAGEMLAVYLVLTVYLYTGLALLISMVKRRIVTLLASAVVLFIAPLSVSIILGNYMMFSAKPGLAVSIASYIFNPMLAYWYNIQYPGFIRVSWIDGLIIDTIVMLMFYAVFILLFVRSEIKI